MAGRDRAKRAVGFADDVKPAPQPGGARGVHGEVAGIVDRAFTQFLQVKRARPLQDHWGDLTFAFADMGLQPLRNEPRQLRRKRSGPARQGTADHDEAGDSDDLNGNGSILLSKRFAIGPMSLRPNSGNADGPVSIQISRRR